MKRLKTGGGWAALKYTLRMANRVGWWNVWQAMRSKNACKTCALGMGGQKGGMRNELGSWPEVCKKSFQAMVADMQQGIKPEFFAKYSLDQLRSLSPRELEYCGRLTEPVYAGPGDTHYKPVTWDFALGRIADQLRNNRPDQTFFYASGRSSGEAGFLLQLFARLYGTNFVNNCSFYCHQASGVGLKGSLGTGTATVGLEDLEKADLFFLIGGNPASNHPRLMTSFMHIRRRRGKVIVINPVRELGLVNFSIPSDPWSLFFGSEIASRYLMPHIGGDIAVMTGIAKRLIERDAVDHDFIDKATDGFADVAERVKATDWEQIERISGVSRADIEGAADDYAAAKSAVFGWTMGITHHLHGVQNVQWIVNLALMRGMAGRPHAGLLPIRGHSNVQGIGSLGVTPDLKKDLLDNLEKYLGVTLPRSPGLDTMACMDAAEQGRVNSALCLGGNLYGSNPDAAYAGRALAKLDLVTYLNTTLNTTHTWGRAKETLILPVLARDEDQPSVQESMFNYVRLSSGGKPRHAGPRGEVAILAELGQRVFAGRPSPVDWSKMPSHACVRNIISAVVPGFEGVKNMEKTRKEFSIPGRVIHTPTFPTPNGRAKFFAHAIPEVRLAENELRMMTVRSEGQFNTVVYEEQDIYRHQERRDVILMAAADIARLNLRVDQPVTIRSRAGVLHNVLVREFDVRAGNALMYCPEANVLIPRDVDPQSKTPAFKNIVITIEAPKRVELPLA